MSAKVTLKRQLRFRSYVSFMFVGAAMLFVFNWFFLRPEVLENDYHEYLKITVLSLPNFCEAVMGMLLLTGIFMQLRYYFKLKGKFIKKSYLYFAAFVLVTVYVVLQELTYLNLSGNDVYDPYDLGASILGLTLTYAMIRRMGFLSKKDTDRIS